MPNKIQAIITVPNTWLQQLLAKYLNLTPVELKVSAFLSFSISSSAVAEITGRSLRTIEFTRNEIRKRMNLQTHENLFSYLKLISNSAE